MPRLRFAVLCALVAFSIGCEAQPKRSAVFATAASTTSEHAFGGLPGDDVLIRVGYIVHYEPARRIPMWVGYHVVPDYLNTPKREGRFSSFRKDPDVAGEPSTTEYVGTATHKYVRGHMAPYFVMGGDRDGDGKYAHLDTSMTDVDEELTVKQGNYTTNIAPQKDKFNGSGGLWNRLETWNRNKVKNKDWELWIFAGCIFDSNPVNTLGTTDIHAPDRFFKIVVIKQPGSTTLSLIAFIFPNTNVNNNDVAGHATTVDAIEAATGLDFFADTTDITDADEAVNTKTTFEGLD